MSESYRLRRLNPFLDKLNIDLADYDTKSVRFQLPTEVESSNTEGVISHEVKHDTDSDVDEITYWDFDEIPLRSVPTEPIKTHLHNPNSSTEYVASFKSPPATRPSLDLPPRIGLTITPLTDIVKPNFFFDEYPIRKIKPEPQKRISAEDQAASTIRRIEEDEIRRFTELYPSSEIPWNSTPQRTDALEKPLPKPEKVSSISNKFGFVSPRNCGERIYQSIDSLTVDIVKPREQVPLGMHFVSENLLVLKTVDVNSPADQCGASRFIGRLLEIANGEPVVTLIGLRRISEVNNIVTITFSDRSSRCVLEAFHKEEQLSAELQTSVKKLIISEISSRTNIEAEQETLCLIIVSNVLKDSGKLSVIPTPVGIPTTTPSPARSIVPFRVDSPSRGELSPKFTWVRVVERDNQIEDIKWLQKSTL